MSLEDIQQALLASYAKDGGINHLDGVNLPAQPSINQLAVDCMHLLFPGFFEESRLTKNAAGALVSRLLAQLDQRLVTEIEKCLRFGKSDSPKARARDHTAAILSRLPALRALIQTDVAAAIAATPPRAASRRSFSPIPACSSSRSSVSRTNFTCSGFRCSRA
jgi:serine O-acetyltransferase